MKKSDRDSKRKKDERNERSNKDENEILTKKR
jgi:hypothetical protein